MKKIVLLFLTLTTAIVLSSCAMAGTSRERTLLLGGRSVSETEFGGVVRWYAVDKYGNDNSVRFQVGYFIENEIGFVLFDGGTRGELASFYRQGLNLRWDWDEYAIVIKPDGTALYYDFRLKSTDVEPRGLYKAHKF